MSEEKEAAFWQRKLLATASMKSLINTIDFYNGKVCGLRKGDHRDIVVNNFEVGSNFVTQVKKPVLIDYCIHHGKALLGPWGYEVR